VYVVAFGTPALAFAGGLIGQLVTRRGAVELEKRSKREEVMRILRWAAELGVSADEAKARLGRAELDTLLDADLLDEEERETSCKPRLRPLSRDRSSRSSGRARMREPS
jgi:hypothetical protein